MLAQLQAAGLSGRAACRWSGYSRTMLTYDLQRPARDADHLRALRRVARANPRYGYRRVAVQSQLGFGQTWRLWKQHDFRLGPQRPRRKRAPTANPPRPCRADHPNHVWTYDLIYDQLADGRVFVILSIVDEFTRECLALYVAFTICADDVVAQLRQVVRRRGAPGYVRSDNGGHFIAQVVQTWLHTHTTGPVFITPGQPWENGFIESFHDKLRDECLQREWFASLAEARIMIERWRKHYNTRRPHSALGYQTPAQFAAAYPTHPAESLISPGHKK